MFESNEKKMVKLTVEEEKKLKAFLYGLTMTINDVNSSIEQLAQNWALPKKKLLSSLNKALKIITDAKKIKIPGIQAMNSQAIKELDALAGSLKNGVFKSAAEFSEYYQKDFLSSVNKLAAIIKEEEKALDQILELEKAIFIGNGVKGE